MRSRAELALLVVAQLAACGASSPFEVELDQITPAAATNIAPVPVVLDGAFSRGITNSLDNGKAEVASVEVLVDDMPLTDVVWQEQRIDATIPAGLAPGLHDITVRIGGRSDTLENGYAITGANLTATLSGPAVTVRTNTFDVTLTVTNDGISAADALDAPALMLSGMGMATLTTPPTGGASLAPGASTDLVFQYTATAAGTVVFTGHAAGMDSLSGLTVRSPDAMSNTLTIFDVSTVIGDPLGDGSPFGFVTGYQNHVYIGPNESGTTLSRVLPDGTGLESGLTMTFGKDTTGNPSASSAATYTSIGYTGCAANTSCGPDNEDGRGLFTSGNLSGVEWLVLGGSRSSGDLDYIYMSRDTGTVFDFRYVDLSSVLGPATKGFSAAHFLGSRLYLGFPDTGGSKPYFVALTVAPLVAPGLDAAAGTQVIDLKGDAFPGFASSNPAMIDSMGDIGGLLYVANHAGVIGARTQLPGPYNTTEWANATPTTWTAKSSRQPFKEFDLTPAERAVPGFAAFGGRLFMGRNTADGPQLWICDPGLGLENFRCEPGDWSLAAPNTTGDTLLTQFNNTALTSISMVVSTTQYLYVGFESSAGVQIYRTGASTNLSAASFEGQGGCTANMSACVGIAGSGLGDVTSTRIFDSKSITIGADESVWVTVGNNTGAARLVMLP